MPQAVGFAVLAGLISSTLFLALSSGMPGMVLLAYFIQLPLLFVGLSLGLAASVIAAGSAILVCSLIAGVVAAALFALVQAVPAVMVIRQALLSRQQGGKVEWYPPGLVLAQLATFAALCITASYLVLLGHPGGLQGVLSDFIGATLAELGGVEAETAPGPELGRWMFLFPGLMAASWLVMVVVNGVLAQALAVRLGLNRRPSPALSELELPGWLWPAIGVAALLAVLGDDGLGFLGRSLLIVLVVPYMFLGLAVIHAFARRWSHRRLALTVFYGGVMLLGWPLLAILLLGFVEDWAHVRQRFL
jgi:Predicted membrane protein (DUF2232)